MKKGFTLIELLVVVLIIGILSAVALPQYTKAVYKTRAMRTWAAASSMLTAVEAYYLANNTCAESADDLDLEAPARYPDKWGVSIPSRSSGWDPYGGCSVAIGGPTTDGKTFLIYRTLQPNAGASWYCFGNSTGCQGFLDAIGNKESLR